MYNIFNDPKEYSILNDNLRYLKMISKYSQDKNKR